MLIYRPLNYSCPERQTLSVCISVLNLHCARDNEIIQFILVYSFPLYTHVELKYIHSNTLLESFHYLSKNSPKIIQSSFLELRNILSFILLKSSGNLEHRSGWDQDNSNLYICHSFRRSESLKTVGTQSYSVFRSEEMSMRLWALVLADSNCWRRWDKYFGQLTWSICSTD